MVIKVVEQNKIIKQTKAFSKDSQIEEGKENQKTPKSK